MFVRRLFTAALLTVALLSLSFTLSPAKMGSAAADKCTDGHYLAPIYQLFNTLQAHPFDFTKPNTVGDALVSIISLRNHYEETDAPAGCEHTKWLLIQVLALREDPIYAQLAAAVDTKNVADYKDLVAAGIERYQKAGKALNDVLAEVTITGNEAQPTAAATAPAVAAPHVCADKTYDDAVKADVTPLKGAAKINVTDWIHLRYKYEDEQHIPAGCEDGTALLIRVLSNGEDQAAIALVSQADKSRADAYNKWLASTVTPRTQSLGKALQVAFPNLAK